MGCAQSKIDNEESVSRCKERRNFLKEAVSVRNAFASAHSGYSISLKDTGAALSDYAGGEVPPPPPELVGPLDLPPSEQPQPPPPPPSHMDPNIALPPPPLPSFSPFTPLQRASTMPVELSNSLKGKGKMKGISIHESDEEEEEEEEEEKLGFRRKKKGVDDSGPETPKFSQNRSTPPEIRGRQWDYFFADEITEPVDEEEEGHVEGINGNLDYNFDNMGRNVEFKTPEKQMGFEGIEEFKTPESYVTEKQFMHSNTAPPAMSQIVEETVGIGKVVQNDNGVNLLKVLKEIDDHFLQASECSQEVSLMLEATRLHYRGNYSDIGAQINHAERVMQVITWNKSFKGAPNGAETKDNPAIEDNETHATVMEKLLAWEKKLYEEVKAGELIKLEYQRKVAVLNRLKKRSASSEQLEKAKAAVSHLHTRYIVDMQSLDSTVVEVNDIRDKQLYTKLVGLVHGMAKMWKSMCEHHESQLKIVTDLKSLVVSSFLIETTPNHHFNTKQICAAVERWHMYFDKLVTNQKQYIHTLHSWLKLNLIPIESNLKEKVSSPQRIPIPPIQPLLRSWNELLEKLPDELAKGAIASFAAVIKTIIIHQEEEMKLKDKYEETRKEYLRKKQSFEEWYQKYMERRTPDETDPDKMGGSGIKDPVTERQFVVDSLKKRLDDEMEEHQKHCKQVREKSLGNLRVRLPELFRALSDYARACSDTYESLSVLTQSEHGNRGS